MRVSQARCLCFVTDTATYFASFVINQLVLPASGDGNSAAVTEESEEIVGFIVVGAVVFLGLAFLGLAFKQKRACFKKKEEAHAQP